MMRYGHMDECGIETDCTNARMSDTVMGQQATIVIQELLLVSAAPEYSERSSEKVD